MDSKSDETFRRRTGQALKYREEEAAGNGPARPQPELRRLTHSQYNHTVRDLLGDQTAPGEPVPARRFRQRLPQSVAGAESLAAADRGLQRRGREAGPQRLPRRRYARADSVQALGRLPRAIRSRVRTQSLPPAARYRTNRSGTKTLMTRETDFLKGAQLVVEAMLQSSEFPVPAGRNCRSEMEAVRHGEPALVRDLGHACRTRSCSRRRRAANSPRRRASRRPRGACSISRVPARRWTNSSASGCASTAS